MLLLNGNRFNVTKWRIDDGIRNGGCKQWRKERRATLPAADPGGEIWEFIPLNFLEVKIILNV